METLSYILILLVCLVLSAFFSSSETALLRVRGHDLDEDVKAASGPGVLAARDLLDSTSRLLVTILLGNNVVNIAAASVATALGVRYLGEEIGAAAALDLAVVSRLTAITPGVVHGALICEAEGVSLEQFAAMYPPGDRAYSLAMMILNNDFESNIAASVNVAIGVATSIKRQSQELGINSDFPDFQLSLYHRAVAAGLQNQDTASLIKVLRADTSN